ncbi:MAG: hypothetical protein ACOC6J_08540 [Spirochaetota bacterium]
MASELGPGLTQIDTPHLTQKRIGLFRELAQNRISYLLLLPAVVYTFVYGYATMPYLVMAFQRFSFRTTIFTAEWIGRRNFEFFLASNRAWQVTFNTLRLKFLFIVFGTLFAMVVAIRRNGYDFFPESISFEAYRLVLFSDPTVPNAYLISIIVTVTGTAVATTITAMAAFALESRHVRYGSFFALLFITMVFHPCREKGQGRGRLRA